MTTSPSYLLVRRVSAPKTSLNAKGNITYAVLRDDGATEAYFCLLGNEGGGYFSQEAVAFADIQRCLSATVPSRPVPAKLFKSAFRGRSVNNPGFLVTALRHEGLLNPAPESSHHHVMGKGWDEWKAAVIASSGEPFELPEVTKANARALEASTNAGELPSPPALKTRKPRKSPGEKHEHPTTAALGDKHAPPA